MPQHEEYKGDTDPNKSSCGPADRTKLLQVKLAVKQIRHSGHAQEDGEKHTRNAQGMQNTPAFGIDGWWWWGSNRLVHDVVWVGRAKVTPLKQDAKPAKNHLRPMEPAINKKPGNSIAPGSATPQTGDARIGRRGNVKLPERIFSYPVHSGRQHSNRFKCGQTR